MRRVSSRFRAKHFTLCHLQIYEWNNGVLTFYDSCPQDSLCDPIPETGRLAGDTLTITYGSQFLRERTYLRLR